MRASAEWTTAVKMLERYVVKYEDTMALDEKEYAAGLAALMRATQPLASGMLLAITARNYDGRLRELKADSFKSRHGVLTDKVQGPDK